MKDEVFVVVFPSIFSKNKITALVTNIKKLSKYKIKNFVK